MIRNLVLPDIILEPAFRVADGEAVAQALLGDLEPFEDGRVLDGVAVGAAGGKVRGHGADGVDPAEAHAGGPVGGYRVAGGDGRVVGAGDGDAFVVAGYVEGGGVGVRGRDPRALDEVFLAFVGVTPLVAGIGVSCGLV